MKQSPLLIALLTLSLAGPVLAQTKAEQEAAMKKAMELGTPGAQHKVLEPLVGKWDAMVKTWMGPGTKASESKGTEINQWVFGGRFLSQEYKGDWEGQAFQGQGYIGYDNVKKEYQNIWMDSMMTGIMSNPGTYDAATKTLKSEGTFGCPMTGKTDRWFRSELKIQDNNNHTYTSYAKDESGKEFKSMEIIYKRTQQSN